MKEKLYLYITNKILAWHLKKFYALPDFQSMYESFEGKKNVDKIKDPGDDKKELAIWSEMWDDLMQVRNKQRLVDFFDKATVLLLKEMHFDHRADTQFKRSNLLFILYYKQLIQLAMRVELKEKNK